MFNVEISRDRLHTYIAGGFPAGSLMMVEGPETCGKSAIAQRFAYGFLKNDVSVTYITTELSVREFIDQMFSLGYDIGRYLLTNKMAIISVFPMLKGLKDRSKFIKILMNSRSLYTKDILIIDTFSSLMSQSVSFNTEAKNVISFFKKIASSDKMILLTVDPQEVGNRPLSQFKSDVGIYIELSLKRFAGAVVRDFNVKRFIGATGRVQPKLSFRVEPGIGFVAEITETA